MTAIGAIGTAAFAALVWGSILLVLAIFAYETYDLVRELRER